MSIQSLSSASCSVYSAPRAENLRRPSHAERDESARGCGEEPRSQRRQGGMGALFDALSEELRALAKPAAATPAAAPAADAKPVATDTKPATDAAKPAKDCACVDEAEEKKETKEAKEKQPDLRAALKNFTEALFDSLRELAGDGGRGHGCHGRGHGWGRGGMSSLADRIEALAQKLAAGAAPAAPAAPAQEAPAATPAPPAPVAAPEVATPDTATVTAPVTVPAAEPVSDTIHVDPTPLIAKAEPSDLEESFASLWKALDPDRLKKEEGGSLSELLAFLHRMADRLGQGGTGQLVDTVA